ncbi:MAG: stage II sporulation protein M [Pirellulales bacterium]|nr:stage II sporulation protein M [Pirellulales bacterium]
MKVALILEKRRQNWHELQGYCDQLESQGRRSLGARAVLRFASLYRSVCGDLALAESYQLPASTIAYLHQLVGRAHNHLYRSPTFRVSEVLRELLWQTPQRLFHDNYLRLAFALFWGFFFATMYLGYAAPDFAEGLVGREALTQLEEMYEAPVTGRNFATGNSMAGFYVWHNAGIGLQCFAGGLLFGIGGLFTTITNAVQLGTMFGHMATTPQRLNFFQFVTAHGPFELTAIVLSSAAGMRLGFALIDTQGCSRRDALLTAGRQSLPIAVAAISLFALAAVIEGFISPSAVPYWAKACVAAASSAVLMFYFVVLGWPRGGSVATG